MRRKRFRGRSLSGRTIGKAVLAALAVGLLGWQVVRSSAASVYESLNPFVSLRVNPGYPAARLNLAMAEFTLRGGRVSETNRKGAMAAFRRAPLAEEPLFLGGVLALSEKRDADGERLVAEATRRNPRFRMARLLLLNHYLQTGDIPRAGVEMAVLNRLIPEASDVLVNQVADMVRDPVRGAALMRVLKANPAMQQSILARLASKGADPALILRIAAAAPAGPAGGEASDWQRLLVGGLVEQGRFYQAHQLWLRFNHLTQVSGAKGVHDGAFKGGSGGPPFGWLLTSAAAGVAERTGAGLEVEYYGRETAELASQLLLLAPGSYRLQFRAEGDASGDGSSLSWIVTCAGDNRTLLEQRLTKISSAPRALAAAFTVPAGCPAQWLKLVGRPDEFPTQQNVTINALGIAAARSS